MRDQTSEIVSAGSLIAVLVIAGILANVIAIKRAAGAEVGIASVYSGLPSEGGRKASNGETINPRALTAAHRTLPFGTIATVTNRRNGRKIMVRITDRGPFKRGRIIDVMPAVNVALGSSGLCPVTVEVR
jgi:rare lipoprotein A